MEFPLKISSNLADHIITQPDYTALQYGDGVNIVKRLQVNKNDNAVHFYGSTDGGRTWPIAKDIIDSSMLGLSGIFRFEAFYDATNDTCVIKWFITENMQYQLCVNRQQTSFDSWNGIQWTNIWVNKTTY